MGKYLGCNPDLIGAEKDKEIQVLREALEQALRYVERDETAHGRQFGTGNAIRAALRSRGAVKSHGSL